jgi:hypothetical protein
MKNPTSLLVLLLVVAAASPVAAQSHLAQLVEISPPSLLEDEAPLFDPRHISCGMTAAQVTEAMRGRPDVRPAPDLWVYWHFNSAADRTGKFNTLVVYFTEGRVTKYRLVERKALEALLAAVKKAQSGAVAKQ